MQLLLLAMGIFSCKKESEVNDFIEFGRIKVDNATMSNTLDVQLAGHEKKLGISEPIKLVPGPNHLIFWGGTGNPKDTLVPVFDTVLQVLPGKLHDFVLFQPAVSIRPVALQNNQAQESQPPAGFIKVKVANYATHCFPGAVDLVIRMTDYNIGDLVDVDIIKQVTPSFGAYVLFTPIPMTYGDGFAIFQVQDPVTHESLYNDLIPGVNFAPAGKLLTIATLFITETRNDNGVITGTDGNKYVVEVKTLFLN